MTQSFVMSPPTQPAAKVQGEPGAFPVRRIFCVGRNYADHVREMGGDPRDTPPVFFTKPADALVNVDDTGTHDIAYPPKTTDYHHEVELVIALRYGGRNIPKNQALNTVYGYAVGIDFTRRDLQRDAAAKGQPWDMAKGFDQSAVLGPIKPQAGQDYHDGTIRLSVNGEQRQSAPLSHMIWDIPSIISSLSHFVELMPGDLIFTGTPEGVGPVRVGQTIDAGIDGLPGIRFTITACRH